MTNCSFCIKHQSLTHPRRGWLNFEHAIFGAVISF